MNITVSRWGLFIMLRYGQPGTGKDPVGLVIKQAKHMLFSERHDGYRRAWKLGPLYVRTCATKPLNVHPMRWKNR